MPCSAVLLLFKQHGPGLAISLRAAEVCDDEVIDLLLPRGPLTPQQQQNQQQHTRPQQDGGAMLRASLRSSLKSLLVKAGVGAGSAGGAHVPLLTQVVATTAAQALAVLRVRGRCTSGDAEPNV